MSRWAKFLIRNGMQAMLLLSAALARRPHWQDASFAWSHVLARLAIRRRRIKPVADLAALGRAWQSSFPSPKQVPIEAVADGTVYARIETPCPLRGSGDTGACWRMMAYDRAVARAAGGQFVVLQSQAEPGVTACRVALRVNGAPLDDLLPAHIRAPARRSL